MSNWGKLLKQKGYTIDSLGNATKSNIESYTNAANDFKQLKQFEGQEGYDEDVANQLERQISDLDAKISKSIEMRERQLSNIQKMQDARNSKKQVKQVETAQPKVEEKTVVVEQPKVEEKKQIIEEKPKEVVEQKKEENKKNNTWLGYALATAGVVILGALGINKLRNS